MFKSSFEDPKVIYRCSLGYVIQWSHMRLAGHARVYESEAGEIPACDVMSQVYGQDNWPMAFGISTMANTDVRASCGIVRDPV